LPKDASLFETVDPFRGARRVDEHARDPEDRRVDDPFALECDQGAAGYLAPEHGNDFYIAPVGDAGSIIDNLDDPSDFIDFSLEAKNEKTDRRKLSL